MRKESISIMFSLCLNYPNYHTLFLYPYMCIRTKGKHFLFSRKISNVVIESNVSRDKYFQGGHVYVCLVSYAKIKNGVYICIYIEKRALYAHKSGWPSGLRRQTQVLVLVRERGFKSHF